MNATTSEAALARLRSTIRSGASQSGWLEAAEALETTLGTLESNDPGKEGNVRSRVEEASGLSWGIVTRYVSVLRRIRSVAAAHGVPLAALASRGFNASEAAVRLYARSPEQGIEALLGRQAAATTLGSIRRKLAAAPVDAAGPVGASRQLIKAARGYEIELAERALASRSHDLFPRDCSLRRRPGLLYFRRVGYEACSPDGRILAGIDVLVVDALLNRDALDGALAQSVLLSTFFPTFHLVFSSGSDIAVVRRAADALEIMDVLSVGIVRVTDTGDLDVLRSPSGGPVPDRTRQYDLIRQRFAVGRSSPTEL